MSPAYDVWDIDLAKVYPAYLELALHSQQTMTCYAVQMKGTTARRRMFSAEKLCDINVPLTAGDLAELERVFTHELGTADDYRRVYGKPPSACSCTRW